MSGLGETLERLGLSQYLNVLVAEGFDTWETVLDITESDLKALNVKLGHRRKLQRAIAVTRAQNQEQCLPLAREKASSIDRSFGIDYSTPESKSARETGPPASAPAAISTKRKYRRHAKPDEHAPERPASAYVIFSNQIREELKDRELSITEIAKIIGERWRVLSPPAREACERQANTAKEKYYVELAEYKKTPQYAQDQKYLEEFKAKHAAPAKEGKGLKLEMDTSTSTRSNSHEHAQRGFRRLVSSTGPIDKLSIDKLSIIHQTSRLSPSPGPYSRPSGYYLRSDPASLAKYSVSGGDSLRLAERYSPISGSPRSTTVPKNSVPGCHTHPGGVSALECREHQFDGISSLPHTPPGPPHSRSSSSHSSLGYGSVYQGGVDLPSRQPSRETSARTSLSHGDTTLSSEGTKHINTPHHGSLLRVVDSPISQRLLPQPVPTLGAIRSPLDPRPPQIQSLVGQHLDYPAGSLLAGLFNPNRGLT